MSRRTLLSTITVALVAAALLGACTSLDDFQREVIFRPSKDAGRTPADYRRRDGDRDGDGDGASRIGLAACATGAFFQGNLPLISSAHRAFVSIKRQVDFLIINALSPVKYTFHRKAITPEREVRENKSSWLRHIRETSDRSFSCVSCLITNQISAD